MERTEPVERFYGHGKLLLTAEYYVLDGALALALPTHMGQSLEVRYRHSFDPQLHWKSYDFEGKVWFEESYDFWHFNTVSGRELTPKSIFLQKIFQQVRKQNPHFLREESDVLVETHLEFPQSWGLGSSSTLLYNISQWAYVSPFELLFKTMGGSGYDIACAQANGPILYERKTSGPFFTLINFDPPFKDQIYFVYLGNKQNSREAIDSYRQRDSNPQSRVKDLSAITQEFVKCRNVSEFNSLIKEHEKIISYTLDFPRARDLYFSDYWGEIKSLGAWGGDFVLATSDRGPKHTQEYFQRKGLGVCIPYEKMIMAPQNEIFMTGLGNHLSSPGKATEARFS